MDRAGQASTSDGRYSKPKLAVPYAMGDSGPTRSAGAVQRRELASSSANGSVWTNRSVQSAPAAARRPAGAQSGRGRDGLVSWTSTVCRLCLTRNIWRRCWRGTTSRRRSRTTVTCWLLSKNLQQWEEKLGIYGDMLTTRRQAFAERVPQVRGRASAAGLTRSSDAATT